MDIVNVTWAVSNEAKELVKSGEAIFSSGGIRLLDGTLKELAVPIVKTTSNELTAPPVLSAMNSYSSTQLADLIKSGTQLTSGKLESVLNMSTKLCLNTALSWANAAISLANCGLAFVFYKKQTNLIEEQNNKIDEVINILKDINDKIEQIDNRNRAEKIRSFFNKADMDIVELSKNNYNLKKQNRDITGFLIDFASFLESLIDEFEKGIITDDYYVQSIFLLGSLFTKEVDLFCRLYCQVLGYEHKKFDDWCRVIDRIDKCEQLKRRVKSMIMLQSPEISPLEKRDYYQMLNLTFSNHSYYLQLNKYIEKKIPVNINYSSLDELINSKIKNNEPLVI